MTRRMQTHRRHGRLRERFSGPIESNPWSSSRMPLKMVSSMSDRKSPSIPSIVNFSRALNCSPHLPVRRRSSTGYQVTLLDPYSSSQSQILPFANAKWVTRSHRGVHASSGASGVENIGRKLTYSLIEFEAIFPLIFDYMADSTGTARTRELAALYDSEIDMLLVALCRRRKKRKADCSATRKLPTEILSLIFGILADISTGGGSDHPFPWLVVTYARGGTAKLSRGPKQLRCASGSPVMILSSQPCSNLPSDSRH
ncbi:hypothetical protein AB1N83_012371 [Pleurotus pulmonarius]